MLNRFDIDDLRSTAYSRIVEICKSGNRNESKKNFDEICSIIGFIESVIDGINEREGGNESV